MARRKTERLLNLLIMLLAQRRPVPKAKVREILYPDQTEDAFERMFDRDKEELRSLGVPIEVDALDHYFEDEVGYRVPPEQFALPEVSLTADEAAVLSLAGKVWQHATLAEATSEALRKLQAADVAVDTAALGLVEPHLSADEPAFDVFWQATWSHTEVVFDYRRPGDREPTRRRLQPWGVVRQSARWYVVGWDVDRADERVFRLSRVVGEARTDGPPGSFEVPAGTDVRATARRLAPAPAEEEVTVLVRAGTGHALRRTSREVLTSVPGPDDRTRWDRLVLVGASGPLLDEILSHGSDAYVESPASVRERLLQRIAPVAREGTR